MTQKMKTVCVGRLLIDLPEEAEAELTRARIGGFDIVAFNETADAFQKRVQDREAQLRAKPDQLGGNRNLELAREIHTDSGLTGKIFVHTRTVTEGTAANGLELERYRYESVSAEALVHAAGISIDLEADDYDPGKVDALSKLLTQLVANPGNAIPSEPGYCIAHAYVKDPLKASQGEQIMMLARLPSHPDIDLMLILSAGLKPDKHGLLARSEAAVGRLSMAEKARVSTLRAAPREIGGLPGEELVELFVEESDARVHSFWWEVSGTENDVFLPHLVFKMNTGIGANGPVPSSLSEGSALGLWDKLTSSIRLRPTAVPASTRVEPPTVPIGTYASAGDTCPESGWWHCGDGGKGVSVQGGQRQYIRKGELMPQALLLPPPTLWDKMRGLQPSFEAKNRTPWKLVDKRARKRSPPALPLAMPILPAHTAAAGSSPSLDEARHVAVGSFAATGFPCPASGWWQCEASHALDGTRWFAQGVLLPPATFAIPPGVFGRSANTPKSIQRRGEWRLVRLAEASSHDAAAPASQDPDQA